MSGLINSVGSKSGIIGSTEIPGGYEEGTWTATLATGYSTTPTATAYYTKIGEIIHLSLSTHFGSLGMGNSAVTITGVPFATGTPASCTSGATARIQATDANWRVSGTTISLQRMQSEMGAPASVSSQSSGTYTPTFDISLTYRIA